MLQWNYRQVSNCRSIVFWQTCSYITLLQPSSTQPSLHTYLSALATMWKLKISSLQCTTRTRVLIRLLDGIPRITQRISRSNPIYCTRSYGIEIRNVNSLCEPVLVWLLLPAGNLICVCDTCKYMWMYVFECGICNVVQRGCEWERKNAILKHGSVGNTPSESRMTSQRQG